MKGYITDVRVTRGVAKYPRSKFKVFLSKMKCIFQSWICTIKRKLNVQGDK